MDIEQAEGQQNPKYRGNGGRDEGENKITKGFLDVNDVEVRPLTRLHRRENPEG